MVKLKDVLMLIYDKVKIYEDSDDGLFVDLYKGEAYDLPTELENRIVASIGAARKGIVDIRVATPK